MTVKFEVKTTMNDDLMMQASRLYTAMTQRPQKIFRLVVGILLLIESGVLLWTGNAIGWLLLAGGVYLIAAAMLLVKVIYRRTVRANEEHRGIITTIRFEKDRFTVTNRVSGDALLYTAVSKIGENKDSFCIISGKGNGTHMPKDCFTMGAAEEFRAFIEQKTGKKVKNYR